MQNKRRTAQNSAEQRRTREEHAILGPGGQILSKGSSGFLKAPKNMTTKHKKDQFCDITFLKNTPPRPSVAIAALARPWRGIPRQDFVVKTTRTEKRAPFCVLIDIVGRHEQQRTPLLRSIEGSAIALQSIREAQARGE